MTFQSTLAAALTFPDSIEPITEMAITVDDLPVHSDLPDHWTYDRILKQFIQAFKKHHLTHTYGFVNALAIDRTPDLIQILKGWKSAGHLLGSHTYSHLDYATHTLPEFTKDILANELTLKSISPSKEYHYFRFPFLSEGNTLDKFRSLRDFLKENKYQIAPVTTDFHDWRWNDILPSCIDNHSKKDLKTLKKLFLTHASQALIRAKNESLKLFHRPAKQILLIHFGAFDAIMLDKLLTLYEKSGVKFISLDEALTDPMYNQEFPKENEFNSLRSITEAELIYEQTHVNNTNMIDEKNETDEFDQYCRSKAIE